MEEQVKVLEVAGLMSSILGMRLPTQSQNDSYVNDDGEFILGSKDKKLALGLLNKREINSYDEDLGEIFQGDTHGKFQRSIHAWLDITAPLYIWNELDTYMVGMTPTSSTSTMYTLKKELKYIDDIDKTHFSDDISDIEIQYFKSLLKYYEGVYGSVKDIPIDKLKAILPSGWLQRRIRSYSYQTLRRIYQQRKHHRLKWWHLMCDTIETLPYFKELIIGIE